MQSNKLKSQNDEIVVWTFQVKSKKYKKLELIDKNVLF